jgi:DnaJ-class molecular chaperone
VKLVTGCEQCDATGKTYGGGRCHHCDGRGTVWVIVRAPEFSAE